MMRETYKGRTLKVVKGKREHGLHVTITINGENFGRWIGTEQGEMEWAKRTIDAVDSDDRPGRPYAAYWYPKAV